MHEAHDLILGYAFGTPDIAAFVASTRNLADTTAVVLLVDRLPDAVMTACETAGVQLLPFVSARTSPAQHRSPAWSSFLEGALTLQRWLGSPDSISPDALAAAKIALHPNHSRFLHYHDFLRGAGRQYRRIFMTDVRDVVFQRDPFDFADDAPILAFCEEAVNRIGTEKYNRRFILDAFGRATLRELADQVVICAGTIGGGREAVLRYLDVFTRLTFRHPFRPGADQALHNVIMRRQMVPARVHANGEGSVLTLDRVPETALHLDDRHRLVGPSGSPYAVLHMFDRVPAANRAVHRQLGLPIPTTA